MKHLLFNYILISILISSIPSKDFEGWIMLQDQKIQIEYAELDRNWCKATIELEYSVAELLSIIENVDEYYKYFQGFHIQKQSVFY